MSVQENKDIIRRFYEKLNSGDPIAAVDMYLAEEFVGHNAWENREGFKKVVTALKAAYPDTQNCIEDIIAEDNNVAVRLTINGRQKSISAIVVYRIENGKIVEQWAHSDSFF